MLGFGKDKKSQASGDDKSSESVEKSPHSSEFVSEEAQTEEAGKGFLGKLFGRKKVEETPEVSGKPELIDETDNQLPLVESEEVIEATPDESQLGSSVVSGLMNADSQAVESQADIELGTAPHLVSDVESKLQGNPAQALVVTEGQVENTGAVEEKSGFFSRIKKGLGKTGSVIAEGVGSLVLGKKVIDDELMEELETQLLMADVGIDATTEIIDKLAKRVARKQLDDVDALYEALKEALYEMLAPCEAPLQIDSRKPFVLLVVGVNGVGKTTTIGKMARQFQDQGKSVLLAAGDTFRAAAVEQLQVWGERNDVQVVAQQTGADSASVIFDAVAAARSRNVDIVIADTAGRLHNKSNLMEELKKVSRVIGKLDETAPHEVLLVLDAGTGQNAISQAEQFQQAVGVSGIALTKLDGTAKGGVIFALCKRLGLPVRYIGIGESVEDLQVFNARQFVDALFASVSESIKH